MILKATACMLACAALGQTDEVRDQPVATPRGAEVAATVDIPPGYVQSEILSRALAEMVADMVAERVKNGQPVPESWKKPSFLPRAIKELNREAPNLLWVTREQEKKWAGGEFDQQGAKQRIDSTLKVLADFGAELPTPVQHAVTKYKAGELEGAQLELTVRLLSLPLRSLIRELGSDDPGQADQVRSDPRQFDSVELPEQPGRDRPDASSAEERPPLVISITEDGSLYLTDSPITTAQIKAFLTATGDHAKNVSVVIRADREVPFRHITSLLDLFKEYKIQSIHFATLK